MDHFLPTLLQVTGKLEESPTPRRPLDSMKQMERRTKPPVLTLLRLSAENPAASPPIPHYIHARLKKKQKKTDGFCFGIRWWTDKIRDYSGLDASVKLFGRRSNIFGVRGWGCWDTRGRRWTAAPDEVGAPHRSRQIYR